MPSTTACPSLPGQRVNTLTVPYQQSHRQRSASLSSMRITDFQPMDPAAKFTPPQPQPAHEASFMDRVRPKRSAPGLLRGHTPSRSQSPVPAVWRRLFNSRERGRSRDRSGSSLGSLPSTSYGPGSDYDDSMRGDASSRGSSRSMSPESLRRFLENDSTPVDPRCGSSLGEQLPALAIPEEIAEENEDDSNFATSAISEVNPYFTGLSPPPRMQRPIQAPSTSSSLASTARAPLTAKNLSSLNQSTEKKKRPSREGTSSSKADRRARRQAGLLSAEEAATAKVPMLQGANKSASSSAMASPLSSAAATPVADEDDDDNEGAPLTFFDDASTISRKNSDAFIVPLSETPAPSHSHSHSQPSPRFPGYSLPEHGADEDSPMRARKAVPRPTFGISPEDSNYEATLPQLLARNPALVHGYSSLQLLPEPDQAGVDDFASELGWMVDTIGRVQ